MSSGIFCKRAQVVVRGVKRVRLEGKLSIHLLFSEVADEGQFDELAVECVNGHDAQELVLLLLICIE
jgi:hypothetical protein